MSDVIQWQCVATRGGRRSEHICNCLTVDVEDYFCVSALASVVNRSSWDRFPSRVVRNTERVLALLGRHGTKATFFILGWVAERFPGLVRSIVQEGHEVASHGYEHVLVYNQSPAEFEADVRASLSAIEQAAGVRPLGYRAPSFSIIKETLWALDILKRLGFRYDSSISPVSIHDLYGISGAVRYPNVKYGILELPPCTLRFLGKAFPCGGGGGIRLLPLLLSRWAIQSMRRMGFPAVVYLHPWELDIAEPRIPRVSWPSRLRHYGNRRSMESKLNALLREFEFSPIRDVFPSEMRRPVPPANVLQRTLTAVERQP